MNTRYKPGSIFQLIPDKHPFGGQYIVATEIKSWGIQGFVLLDRPDEGRLVRFKGRAYLRPKWEEIHHIGFAEWFPSEEERAAEEVKD